MYLEKTEDRFCSFDKKVVYLIVPQTIRYNEQSDTKLRIYSQRIDKHLFPSYKFQANQTTQII
ncbi:hypothetical protein EZS27_020476 [termite gut metagenome]|uniref:Uncharacterized protein n=1 Tax=termite gut metagenome TaxID=433724 RepID=A0A5J4RB64_9ZZZZ